MVTAEPGIIQKAAKVNIRNLSDEEIEYEIRNENLEYVKSGDMLSINKSAKQCMNSTEEGRGK